MTVVERGGASVAAVAERTISPEQRRGMVLLGSEISLFMVAFGLVGPLTFVPLFVSHLTDHPLAVGAVTAAFQLGWIPQLLVAGYVERTRAEVAVGAVVRRRRAGAGAGADALRAGGAVDRLADRLGGVPGVLRAVVCAGGLATTPWMDVVARTVPAWLRGRFMGGFSMAGTLFGAAGAALAAPLLDWLPFPYGFAACFGLAFGIFTLSLIPLFMFREPPGPPPRPPRPLREQLGELPAVLRADPPFRRYVLGLACAALGTMGNGFLVVYAVLSWARLTSLRRGTRRRCWWRRRRRAWGWGGWRTIGASGRWGSRWHWRRRGRRWWRW